MADFWENIKYFIFPIEFIIECKYGTSFSFISLSVSETQHNKTIHSNCTQNTE